MKNPNYRNKKSNAKPNQGRGKRPNNRPSRKRKASTINPEDLIQRSVEVAEQTEYVGRKFEAMPINHQLRDNIIKKGYENLTEIQDRSFEGLLSGKNLMGIANTGTGKTGAFLIPILERLTLAERPFQTLILVPTRELALQVETECKSMTKGMRVYCISLIGGTNINKDLKKLSRMNQIVVGTPGRVMDLVNRGALKLGPFTTLVLDEFDRMLDMGFVHDVKRITARIKNRKQTILFSATVHKKQRAIIDELLYKPVEIRVSSGETTAESIDQDIVKVADGEDKFTILLGLLNQGEFEKVLVFAETKRMVSRIAKKLKKQGVSVDEIHGDKSQNYRKKALAKFKNGAVKVLVATDVAARGIDVDDVTHVINYQLPQDMESYIHRIGRTGRAGKSGKAITLVD